MQASPGTALDAHLANVERLMKIVEEKWTTCWFLHSLPENVKNKLLCEDLSNVEEIKNKARILMDSTHGQDCALVARSHPAIRCYNCGVHGHGSDRCPDKAKGLECFACQGWGHVSRDCPSRKSKNGAKDLKFVARSDPLATPRNL
ncbi:hypothetical protein Ciccas_010578 [Cichlidogyrus casuarinus]|uniref:CCHC-type domain-containing protein n=1 Tax=Cichlidogyrus casuarinus TaxID=1844966 RepID=A0ABD2PU47_9PLAT